MIFTRNLCFKSTSVNMIETINLGFAKQQTFTAHFLHYKAAVHNKKPCLYMYGCFGLVPQSYPIKYCFIQHSFTPVTTPALPHRALPH